MLSPDELLVLRSSPAEPNRLRKAMELGGLTQVQVASAVGITQPYVSSICKGDYSQLPLGLAQRLSALFGAECTVDDLFPLMPSAAAPSSDDVHESQDASASGAVSPETESEASGESAA